jgi:cell division septal protein FtsQ
VNSEVVHSPAIRSWRDIPQPVKPRAMSAGGRWRRTLESCRLAGLGLLVVGLVWGVWMLTQTLARAPRHVPEVARTVPVRRLELKTSAGGVLDRAWLERTLALPRQATLMELDLERLRTRLLAEGQVASVTIAREFPDRLLVRISERMPVARVRVETGGAPHDWLVAADGFVFRGTGFEDAMLAALPWLGGIVLTPDGAGFRPIADMAPVAQLLADVQFAAMHLYQAWLSVSLTRLASDRELEVTLKNGTTIVFSAAGDFFVQLATLDYLLEKLANSSTARARIDLTLGRNVPVMVEAPAPAAERPAATVTPPVTPRPAAPPPATSSFFSLPSSRN